MRRTGDEGTRSFNVPFLRRMQRCAALLLIGGVAAIDAYPESLSVWDVVDRIGKADPQVLVAQSGVESARTEYRKTLGNTLPQTTLSLDPAYARDQRTVVPAPSADPAEATTHRFGANLTVSQLLPTAGTLTASVGTTATISEFADLDATVTQEPVATLNLVQPLFVNGKLIDLQLYDAANSLAKASWTASQSRLQAIVNAAVISGLSSHTGILALRGQAAYLEGAVDVAKAQLRRLRLNREQGGASSQEVLAAELGVSRQRKALLDVRHSLASAERTLRRAVGLSPMEPLDLNDAIPSVSLTVAPESVDQSLSDNPEVLQRRIELQSARLNGVLSGREYESRLTVTFATMPEYAPDREDSNDWRRSFEDLFSDDASIATTLTVKLTVPLYQGGRARRQRQVNESSVHASERTLAETRQRLRDETELALMRHEVLVEHIELLEKDVRYREQEVAERQQLLELRNLTPLDVRRAELDYQAGINELFQARADLFLNSLQILSLTGHDLVKVLKG